MPDGAPVTLPPTASDLAAARFVARHATPPVERVLRVVTCLADEKAILAAAGLFWAYSRSMKPGRATARRADHILGCAVVSAILPHLIKRLVDRKRPDRMVVRRHRNGIPRSGRAWDSFPSGHAVHLGALAQALGPMVPARLSPYLWPAALSLAATRIMLLAHYPSDVAAGLALGVAVERGVGAALGRGRRA
jgi:undecaprenyl-diphosphatase